MKTQIDNLVRGIHHDLAQPSSAVPELAAFFQTIGADGLSKAIAQRAILGRWAECRFQKATARNIRSRLHCLNWPPVKRRKGRFFLP